jgi:hypothetical protein
MKRIELKLTIVLLIAVSIVMVSCGGNGTKSGDSKEGVSSSNDQLFGKVIEMVADYQDKLAENEADQKKNTDLDKAFKLSQEEKLLKEEAKNKVESYFNELKEPLAAQVVQEGDEGLYKITEVVLTKANFKNFMVKSDVEILDPSAMEGKTIHLQVFKGDEPTGKTIALGCSKVADKTAKVWEFTGGTYCSFLVGGTKLVSQSDSVYMEVIKGKY